MSKVLFEKQVVFNKCKFLGLFDATHVKNAFAKWKKDNFWGLLSELYSIGILFMKAPYYRSNSETEGGTWPGDERKIGSNCHVKQNISHGFKFLLATENVYDG